MLTGIAFEHGRVEVGAGTASQDSNQWTRDFIKDESDIIGADKDTYMVKTVDKVEYEGLIAGKEYVVTGKLYDKETSEALIGLAMAITTVSFCAGMWSWRKGGGWAVY